MNLSANLTKILESAIRAPSGDNCQPWELQVQENQIHLFNLPERDTSLFNYRQRGSLVAHGAFLENLLIAASTLGYKAKTALFPEKSDPDLVAAVELSETKPNPDPLFPYIDQRATNRKRYLSNSLTTEQKTALVKLPEELASGKVQLAESVQDKNLLANLVAEIEQLIFENRQVHDFLFEQIRWTDDETAKTRNGFHIRALELPRVQRELFRWMGNWSFMRILSCFGASRIAYVQARSLYLSSSALGLVAIPGTRNEDFVLGGRILERIWLEATRLGLSFQALGSVLFLQRIFEGATEGVPPALVNRILERYHQVEKEFPLDGKTLLMLFRVGFSSPPSVRTLRLPLEKIIRSSHDV